MKFRLRLFFSFILVGMLSLASASAQDFDFVHQWALGSTDNVTAVEVGTDTSGNRVVYGSFKGSVDFNPRGEEWLMESQGAPDLFVASYAVSGELNFAFSLGRIAMTDGMIPRGLLVAPNGDFVIGGSFRQVVDFDPSENSLTLSSAGGHDAFLAKYTGDGELVWARSIGNFGLDATTALAAGENGQVLQAVHFVDSIDVDLGPGENWLVAQGQRDAALLTWSADGIPVRHIHLVPDVHRETVTAMDYRSETGVAIGMQIRGDEVGGIPESAMYLAVIDTLGNILWDHDYDHVDEHNEIGVLEFSDDGSALYVAGRFRGVTDFAPGTDSVSLTPLFTDAFIAKHTSATGDLQWARFVESDGTLDFAVAVRETADRVILFGAFDEAARFVPGDFGTQQISAGGRDIFTASYAKTDGAFIDAQVFGGVGDEALKSVDFLSDGTIVFCGGFTDQLDLDPAGPAISSQGFMDGFVAVMIDDVFLDVVNTPNLSPLAVFPVPAEDILYLRMDPNSGKEGRIRIFDMRGAVVRDRMVSFPNSELSIALGDVAPGIYVVEATTNKGSWTTRFVKR